ncbi:hypothetical protein AB4Z45_17760 [Paenibacillus sp. MCAF9]|uniref:hypothetical protein n=1 Tax=Paenibacillus sp. MCAF9 TaxID=3233046 RepID=UPI003F9B6540
MKIALICPSNTLHMPYVENYEKLLRKKNVSYTIINWDRFQIEEVNENFKYRDEKIGHQRNYYDYYKYKKFVEKKMKENSFDKVIIFGLQLCYFLKSILIQKYKNKYIVDIRDYNKIINIFNVKNLIDNSDFTVISSSGYKRWLPISEKYVVNHNTQVSKLNELKVIKPIFNRELINISYIGAIRDYSMNISLIRSMKHNKTVNLYYHGEGIINDDLKKYILKNEIKNTYLTGRYYKENEEELYLNSDLVNVLVSNNGINNKTLLPNRLYNSAQYKKQVITLDGTYLAEQVKRYNLGLVVRSFNRIEDEINKYIKEYSDDVYCEGRKLFFEQVIFENEYFNAKVIDFI